MLLSDFDFALPAELIAQTPAEPRDQARLLVYHRASGTFEQAKVADIGQYLRPGTRIVANNSRVRKARMLARLERTTKVLEVLVLEKLEGTTFRCLIGGGKVLAGDSLQFLDPQQQSIPLTGTVGEREAHPNMSTYLIRFASIQDPEQLIEQFGRLPTPPYIKEEPTDPERYQTVFATEVGSAAAPTAGLHFTPELIHSLQAAGHPWSEVTLQVGLGTFLPLRQAEIEANHLHQEKYFLSPEAAAAIQQARSILAVGTTATRTLESQAADQLQAGWGSTELFIYPGYQFKWVNALLTNFHLPHSSLLMLVAAFLGNRSDLADLSLSPEEMVARLQSIYQLAIAEKYRFFSFGDAMLVL